MHQQPWSYLANLAYGVTTTRDPQTGTTDVLIYEDAVDGRTDGRSAHLLDGARRVRLELHPGAGEDIKDLDHARRIMRRYSEYYDTKTIKMYIAGNRAAAPVDHHGGAASRSIMPTTEGALDYRYDITMAIDGYPGQEHTHARSARSTRTSSKLFAESGIAYTPTMHRRVRRSVGRELLVRARERRTTIRSCIDSRRMRSSRQSAPSRAERSAAATPAAGSWTRSTSSRS